MREISNEKCITCNVVDDENHRINDCVRFKDTNLYYSGHRYDFASIYSLEEDVINRTIEVVEHLWDLEHGKNEMKSPEEVL